MNPAFAGLLSVFFSWSVLSQPMNESDIDSMHNTIEHYKALGYSDSLLLTYYHLGGIYLESGAFTNAVGSYHEGLILAEKTGSVLLSGNFHSGLSKAYYRLKKYPLAYEHGLNARDILKNAGDSISLAVCYERIALAHHMMSDTSSLQTTSNYFEKAIALFQDKDRVKLAECYVNYGNVLSRYNKFSLYKEALNNALTLYEQLGDTNNISILYNHFAKYYLGKKDYDNALRYLNMALEIATRTKNERLLYMTHWGLSFVFEEKEDYKQANKHLKLMSAFRDSLLTEESNNLMVELEKKYETEKKQMALDRLKIEKQLQQEQLKKEQQKSERIEVQKESERTFKYALFGGFVLLLGFVGFVLTRYRISQKQKRLIEQQKKEQEKQNEALTRLSIVASKTENVILIMDAEGNVEWVNDSFTRLNGLSYEELIAERGRNIRTISNNPKVSERIEKAVSERRPVSYEALNITPEGKRVWESTTMTPVFDHNGELHKLVIIDSDITERKEAEIQLQEKNKEILDSINYAKRLQEAILPPKKLVKEWLPQSFILYKPKDIVAGDFYWFEPFAPGGAADSEGGEQKEGIIFFAAADCTGHGVPGAMVSVVCSNALSKTLIEEKITVPAKILDRTRELVIDRFGKSEEEIKDGMDIALCSIMLARPDRSTPSQEPGRKPVRSHAAKLQYAGANNPLWVIRKGSNEVEEIKPDKQPIGSYGEEKPFANHKVELQPDDTVYIFSDGFADQFGGPDSHRGGKKFKTANFKRLLISIQNESMKKQKEMLDKAFEEWKGDLEQLDDVCVIGVRI